MRRPSTVERCARVAPAALVAGLATFAWSHPATAQEEAASAELEFFE
jgi:hypothetical protein